MTFLASLFWSLLSGLQAAIAPSARAERSRAALPEPDAAEIDRAIEHAFARLESLFTLWRNNALPAPSPAEPRPTHHAATLRAATAPAGPAEHPPAPHALHRPAPKPPRSPFPLAGAPTGARRGQDAHHPRPAPPCFSKPAISPPSLHALIVPFT